MGKKSLEEFINGFKRVYGDKYSYELVKEVDYKNKITIICPIHGEFQTYFSNFMKGQGYSLCSDYKLNTQQFIEKSKEIHGNKYDYSNTVYKNCRSKVEIYCNKCKKTFIQLASVHLSGSGCNHCHHRRLTKEQFIEKAKKRHGDKFDYSLVEYVNNDEKVKLICPIHGIIEQTAGTHLKFGCAKCNGTAKSNTEEFIEKAKRVHGDKYDYSKVEYKGANKIVCIICHVHGEFFVRSNAHISAGVGCPICNSSKGETKIYNYLKEKNIKFNPQHKFNDCRGLRNPLRFDFYLQEHNIIIEFDGIYHFEPVYFSKRMKTDEEYLNKKLESTKRNDYIKDQYCINNNIRLIRIPYTSYNDIESILDSELFNDSVTFNISLHNINNKIVEADI